MLRKMLPAIGLLPGYDWVDVSGLDTVGTYCDAKDFMHRTKASSDSGAKQSSGLFRGHLGVAK